MLQALATGDLQQPLKQIEVEKLQEKFVFREDDKYLKQFIAREPREMNQISIAHQREFNRIKKTLHQLTKSENVTTRQEASLLFGVLLTGCPLTYKKSVEAKGRYNLEKHQALLTAHLVNAMGVQNEDPRIRRNIIEGVPVTKGSGMVMMRLGSLSANGVDGRPALVQSEEEMQQRRIFNRAIVVLSDYYIQHRHSMTQMFQGSELARSFQERLKARLVTAMRQFEEGDAQSIILTQHLQRYPRTIFEAMGIKRVGADAMRKQQRTEDAPRLSEQRATLFSCEKIACAVVTAAALAVSLIVKQF